MEIALLIIGLCVGFAIGWLVQKNKQPNGGEQPEGIVQQLNTANGQISSLSSTNKHLSDERERLSSEVKLQQHQIVELNNHLTSARSASTHLEERLAEQKGELEKLNERFKTEFENLANRILEEKSQKFTEQNKQSIDGILSPLRDRIKDFEDKVQKVYDTEAAERNVLKGEIKQLMSLNQVMHQDAQNLTKALKGDT